MTGPAPDFLLPPLTRGTIQKRYKRFLADVTLEDGSKVTAHCPNTGGMTGCWAPGAPVELSHSDNPKRKLAWTLERVDMGAGWIGVNTARTNQIIGALLEQRRIEGLDQFESLKREPRVNPAGPDRSRFDFLLEAGDQSPCFVEVKNTSLIIDHRICFPDAVTERGRKHLALLAEKVAEGARGVILFALNRPEGQSFAPARTIDPQYADVFEEVVSNGVEALAVRLRHTETGVSYGGLVEVCF